MFQKVSEWLTEKSDRLIRGEGNRAANGYYATPEAEHAYAAMRENAEEAAATPEMADGGETERRADGFGRDPNDEYGGRVPYRSQRDLQAEAEAQREAQRQAQENLRRQAAQQAQPVQQTQSFQPGYPRGAQTAQQHSNVLPFPGMVQGPEGGVYAHVEYIVLLRSRNECTKVIEYIKSNASVFLNMEFIANDSERQRCVDMLSGAAYTLGCQLNKISQRGIYLISSPSVYVVIDPAMQKFATTQEAQGYTRPEYENYGGYAAPGYGRQGEAAQRGYAQQPRGYNRSAQAGAYAGQQAAYAASAQAGAYTAQQPSYGTANQAGAYAAQQASYNAGSQTSAFAAQQTSAYAAQQASYNAGSQTSAFATQQAGAQTSHFGPVNAAPANPGFTATSPTASFATQPKRSASPFGMQSAFAKGTAAYPQRQEESEDENVTARFAVERPS